MKHTKKKKQYTRKIIGSKDDAIVPAFWRAT